LTTLLLDDYLAGKIAPQVLQAPKTSSDPESKGAMPAGHERVVMYLYYRVPGTPWIDHQALVAAVLTARRRDVSTVRNILTILHVRFTEWFPAPQERLHFRIWDRRTFILAHAHLYTRTPVVWAQKGIQTCSDERNSLFLEFVRAERLVGEAPPVGWWFTEILKMGMLGQRPRQGSQEHLETKRTWLKAWGYLEQETKGVLDPFWTVVPGLLTWPLAESQFIFTAQQIAWNGLPDS